MRQDIRGPGGQTSHTLEGVANSKEPFWIRPYPLHRLAYRNVQPWIQFVVFVAPGLPTLEEGQFDIKLAILVLSHARRTSVELWKTTSISTPDETHAHQRQAPCVRVLFEIWITKTVPTDRAGLCRTSLSSAVLACLLLGYMEAIKWHKVTRLFQFASII